MKCIHCGSETISSFDYCLDCGAPLRFRRSGARYAKRKWGVIIVMLFVWISGFGFFFKDIFFSRPISSDKKIATSSLKKERIKALSKLNTLSKDGKDSADPKALIDGQELGPVDLKMDKAAALPTKSYSGKEIISGTVNIIDPWQRPVARLRSVLAGNGWVALPARACLSGSQWLFQGDLGLSGHMAGGLWSQGEAVGLWQISSQDGYEKNAGLAVWKSEKPLKWISLETETEYEAVSLGRSSTMIHFTQAELPDYINENGVFLQENNIVGWTFGPWLPGAYLWSGKDSAELHSEVAIAEFYEQTFANGREERFGAGMAVNQEAQILDRIDLFIEGFRLPPKLAVEDTPYYLLVDEVLKLLRSSVENALSKGMAKQIVQRFDNATLKLIGDIDIFMDINRAVVAESGYEIAIRAIEDTGANIVQGLGVDVPALNEMHLELYQNWLQSLVRNTNIEEGELVYEKVRRFYPYDPYSYLLAVEIEILKDNWSEAERLLYQRNYPPEFLDRFELLGRKISELKGQEGKIIVEFEPGASRIPVTVILNGRLDHEFLIDTGASLVTITQAIVDELGLEIKPSEFPLERQVSTAGGVRTAREVVVDSITIGGWVEYEVRALVMDIPGQKGLGLLGLNYLSRFRMDLNSDEGVLALSPK